MDDLNSPPQAMCLLFVLIDFLHLEYPKCMESTFDFIQQVMLNLDRSPLTPNIQSLEKSAYIV